MARTNFTRAALNSLLATRSPEPKFQSFTDTSGMTVTLRSTPAGATILFFCKKRIKGKLHTKSLGGYPDVSLDQARYAFLTAAAELIHNGHFEKPAAAAKTPVAAAVSLSFGDVIDKFLAYKEPNTTAITLRNYTLYLKKLETLRDVPFEQATAALLWEKCLSAELKVAPTTVKNLAVLLKSIGRYAVAMEWAVKNPFEGLSVLMPKVDGGHFKSFADDELEEKMTALFKRISSLPLQDRAAIHFAFLCPLRNAELRSITLEQCLDADAITVKTKTWDEFTTPLSSQAQRLVKYAQANFANKTYLLETVRHRKLGHDYYSTCLRNAGIDDFVIHGVRSCCMQYLVKCDGVKESIASLCLAHKVGNKTEQAYNRGEYLEERRKAMQLWGDFVEKCAGGNVFY